LGPRIGILFQPILDPHPTGGGNDDLAVITLRQPSHRGNSHQGPDVEADISPAHLRAAFDQDGAEGAVTGEDVVEKMLIAAFKYPQRHGGVGEHHHRQGEHGEPHSGLATRTLTMNRRRSLTSPSIDTTKEYAPSSRKTTLVKVSARTTVRSWPSGSWSGRRTGTGADSEPGSTDWPSSSWSSTSSRTLSPGHPHGTRTRKPIPMLGCRAGRERTVRTSHPPPR